MVEIGLNGQARAQAGAELDDINPHLYKNV